MTVIMNFFGAARMTPQAQAAVAAVMQAAAERELAARNRRFGFVDPKDPRCERGGKVPRTDISQKGMPLETQILLALEHGELTTVQLTAALRGRSPAWALDKMRDAGLTRSRKSRGDDGRIFAAHRLTAMGLAALGVARDGGFEEIRGETAENNSAPVGGRPWRLSVTVRDVPLYATTDVRDVKITLADGVAR